MQTILSPLDFSSTSKNALLYATKMARHYKAGKIIILHSYYVSDIEQILPSADFVQLSDEQINKKTRVLSMGLESQKHKLLTELDDKVEIITKLSRKPWTRSIQEVCGEEDVHLIVLGSNGEEIGKSYLGDNIIEISKLSKVPVLIVPPDVTFKPVEISVLAFDSTKVEENYFSESVKKVLNLIDGKVLLLDLKREYKSRNERLIRYLEESFRIEYHQNTIADRIEGIFDFSEKQKPQLIISLPRKSSFLYSLTHRDITSALSNNSKFPVLILK